MNSYSKAHLKKPSKKQPKARPKARPSAVAKAGDDLFNQVIALTGIPAKTIKRELKTILERKNIDVNQLTIDQLRGVVASYLREIMGGLLDRYHPKKPETTH